MERLTMADVEQIANILESAVEKEIEAHRFYSTVAELIADEKGRDMFMNFANDEEKHRQRLELEIIKLGKTLKPAEDIDIDIEVESDFHMNYKEALIMAMQKEDASFRLYIEYATLTTDPELKEVFIRLAEEEVKHKVKFEIEYKRLAVK